MSRAQSPHPPFDVKDDGDTDVPSSNGVKKTRRRSSTAKSRTAVISRALNSAYAEQVYKFDKLLIRVTRDHILPSQCHHEQAGEDSTPKRDCKLCEYNTELHLPHLPEMVFPNNSLIVQHEEQPGVILAFTALDALKLVNASTLPDVQVGPSAVWQQSRIKAAGIHQCGSPFDWTYSTDYQGTVDGFHVSPTNESIDMEKLTRRDPIHFYSQVALYEDELADHGCAQLSVRIRVMPTCFFLLSRFYLRVDGVMVRICDTRVYGEHGAGYLLREWSKREAKYHELSPAVLESVLDSSALWPHLPVVDMNTSRLSLP